MFLAGFAMFFCALYFIVAIPILLLLVKFKIIKSTSVFKLSFLGLIASGLFLILMYNLSDTAVQERGYEEMAGYYEIDMSRTDLKSYKNDSLKYSNLKLQLTKDGKFKFNMLVPFIFDSIGTWTAAGNGDGEWHEIYDRKNDSIPFGQFTELYSENLIDSIFYLNGAPQRGNENINPLYFKKILKTKK